MATVVGTVVGSIIPIPGAQFVLTALGAYIDQQFLLPALFPQPDIEGPRLNELRIQNAEEGAPMNFLVGPNNRVAGTIIWVSDLIEVEETSGGGGKGGGGGSQTIGYNYFVSVAIAFAGRQQITSLDKIIAEGKKIYESGVDQNVSSNQIECDKISGNITDLKSPNGGPDLSVFKAGLTIDVSGFSNGANNGTFDVISSSFNAATGTSRVRIDNGAAVDEAAGQSVTLFQDFPDFTTADMKDITIYLGTDTQAADPLIESFEGAGNVPGFRGLAYASIEELSLRQHGNRIPQLNFLASAGSSAVSTAFASLLQRGGLSASDYDVTDLSDLTVDGYSIAGPEATTKSLQPLSTAFDVIEQHTSSGGLRFFERRNATIIDVAVEDLASHLEGEETPRDIAIEPIESIRLPSEVNVSYLDNELDDQRGNQRERRRIFDIDAVQTLNLPLVLNGGGAEARSIAKRVLWTAVNSRQRIFLQLGVRYVHVQKNDVLRFTLSGITWFLLVHKIDRSDEFIIRFECTVELKSALIQPAQAESPVQADPTIFIPPATSHQVIDIPPIDDSVTTQVGVPVVIGGGVVQDPNIFWGGASIFESSDDIDFFLFDTLPREANIGFAVDALSGSATVGFWDEINTVIVDMFHGVLESKTELEVLNGQNRLLIGDEIIGFQNVTLVGENQWRLDKLIRGLRDTPITGHTAGERVVHLNGGGLISKALNVSRIGTTFHTKMVPSGGNEADYDSQSITIAGKSTTPFAPSHLAAEREVPSTDDVTLSWNRRSRAVCKILGPEACPLVEPTEIYEVEIYTAGTSTVLRTETVTGAQSFVYTAAMQTADGLTAGVSPFDWSVFQMNATIGRGNAPTTSQVSGT